VVAAVAVIMLVCSCAGSARHTGGDSDGRLRAALMPVLAAVPDSALVISSGGNEPLWTSCDGIAGTWGWSDLVVSANFLTSEDELVVFAHAHKVVSKLGWKTERLPEDRGIGSVTWTWKKVIPPVGAARLTLSHDGAWDLRTTVPLPGHVTGC
jgi:hypothetical protein